MCGASTDPTCDGEQHVLGGTTPPNNNWWQCVELAQRFYRAKGWYGGIFPGVDYAFQIYGNAGSLGMTRRANGSITSLRPGDMIVHGPNASPRDEGAGHVAIVNSVSGSTVRVVEQNGSSTGRATYTLSNGTLSRSGMVNIRGVVHDPQNKTGGSSGGGRAGSRSDFDGNGWDDLAWYHASNHTVTTILSNKTSFRIGFQAHDIGNPTWAGVGDFDGDGKHDLAWYHEEDSRIITILSSGRGFGIGFKANGIGNPTWAGNGSFPLS